MSNFLLDSISDVIRPGTLTAVAGQLGQSEQQVARGLQMSVAAVGAGLATKTDDRGFMRQLFDLVTTRGADSARALTDPAAMLSQNAAASPAAGAGNQLLSSVFGGSTNSVVSAIAGATGLRPESATSLLGIAGPLVLGVLGSQVRNSGLNASAFTDWLAGQRDNLLRDAPPALRSVLGVRDQTTRATEPPPPITPRTEPVTVPNVRRGSDRWLWPALAAVLVLGVLWNVLRGGRATSIPRLADTAAVSVRNSTDTVAGEIGRAATAAGAAVSAGISSLGALVTRHLPNGTDLNVPENGVESHLVGYLSDPSHRGDTTWFDFDRLTFETNSANLKPESQDQLKDVAAIFVAYPKVHATVGGYTDNTGDADANMKLSQDRAANVVGQLIVLGVTPDRLSAKGYGDTHPVADNSTEDGRAQNRRIALRITKQ